MRAGRSGDGPCAATALVTAAVSAAWAGITVTEHFWSDPAAELLAVPALGAALVLCCTVVIWWRPAIVAAVAVGTMLVPSIVLTPLVMAGVDVVTGALAVAVLLVLLMGALPRAVLAATGLSHADPVAPAIPDRVHHAQRMLVGCLLGASVVAAAGIMPAAGSDDAGLHLLVAGIGCLILLRARAFSLTCHTAALRAAGLVAMVAAWSAAYRDLSSFRPELVLGTLGVLVLMLVGQRLHGPDPRGPIRNARMARLLDAAEFVLVIVVVIATAGALGIGRWAATVLG